jgi:competence protein ComEA
MPANNNHHYFNFTKRERRGITSIIVFIIIVSVLPFLYPLFIPAKKYDKEAFKKQLAQLQINAADSFKKRNNKYEPDENNYYQQPAAMRYKEASLTGTLFYFNPNTLDDAGWQKLGVRAKTIQTIRNYLAKGGHFKQPGDIAKIWGLSANDANRLIPYVQIAAPASIHRPADFTVAPAISIPAKYPAPAIIDINLADTTAYIALPGIGSKLALRIINFREKLGGFYSTSQVAETFGLPDSVYQKIKNRLATGNTPVKKININTATAEQLKHPYIKYNVANAIVQYRSQHGPFASLQALKQVVLINEELYQKISPYLTIDAE